MASKLTDLTTSYDTFVDNQVLTSGALNKFINYFEDQDRLTRVTMIGVGIVCGFDVSMDLLSSPLQIIVKQGMGITTDGDALYLRKPGSEEPLKSLDLKEIRYTHFLPFDDDNAHYEQFIYGGNQLPLWKLYKSDETASIAPQPLSSFPGNLNDMVVMLYLESYEDESDLCDGLDCDNQGIHQVFELHTLLVHWTDAQQMLRDDEVFDKHELMTTYLQMKDLSVQRVLIKPSNTAKVADLIASYSLSLEGQLITDLKAALTLMSNKMAPYLTNNLLPGIIALIDQKLPSAVNPPSLFFQYRHDLLRDIVDTYNELKELFIRITTECMPAIHAFPKHLMLGRLRPTEEDTITSRFRHQFYESEAVDDAESYKEFSLMVERMRTQLTTYPQLPETEPSRGLLRTGVKITPSRFRAPLGTKAIPFYYTMNTSLLRSWNFTKTRYGKYRTNLSYNTTGLDPSPMIQTPLAHNLEPYNFLRIEGGQGRNWKTVMAEINDLKVRYGLSFDVKAIGIDTDPNIVIDTTNYECEFEDLAVLLKAWVDEQECMLSSVSTILSAYSLKKPGFNKREAIYTPRVSPYIAQNPNFGGAVGVVGLEGKQLKTNLSDLTPSTPQGAMLKTVALGNKVAFGTNSSVLDTMAVDDDTVGYAFMQALNDDIYSSANDLITNGNYYAEQITLQPDALPWEPIQYISIVDNTLQILAYSHVLSNSIPTSIAGITDQVIANYKKNIDNLCVVVKRVQVQHTSDHTLSDKNAAILNSMMGTLNQLCCGSKQLQALLTEIDRRKDEILSRLTLKKFCEEHPGLEHFGGVEPGGTFVLIYLNKGVNVPGGEVNTPDGTVVADLSLPYMCCSDCSPINFVVPRPAVRLSLPKSIFCLGTDQSPMIFQVEPIGGVIKADKVIPGLTIVGNQLYIDTALFPPAFLNQVISFTVNDQVTDCKLTVVQPLIADFVVPQSPATNPVVNFQPVGNFPSGTQFLWEFGDGKSSTQKNTTHTYQLPVNSTNTVTVRLTVTPASGACPTVRERDIEFEQVSIDIQPKTFCINDTTAYPFIITPAGASVNIDGPGVDPNANTFVPADAFVGAVPIFMNGTEVLELSVKPTPTALGSGYVQGDNVYLNGNVAFTTNHYWQLTDSTGESIYPDIPELTSVIPIDLLPPMEPGTVFYATLWAINPCETVSYRIELAVPANTQACSIDAANDIKQYYDWVVQFTGSQTYEQLPGDYRQLFNTARAVFTQISEQSTAYISGTNNQQMFDGLAPLLMDVHGVLRDVGAELPEQTRNVLIMLYQQLVKMFLAIVQCQDEERYWEGAVQALFSAIYGHLDPTNPESFPNRGINIDPLGNFADAVMNVRNFRAGETESWNRINDIYYLLTNNGGGAGFAGFAPPAGGPAEFAAFTPMTEVPAEFSGKTAGDGKTTVAPAEEASASTAEGKTAAPPKKTVAEKKTPAPAPKKAVTEKKTPAPKKTTPKKK